MKTAYFDYNGLPAKLFLDEEDAPDACEIYDLETCSFVRNDNLTLDVYDSFGSSLISKEVFLVLLEKVQSVGG